MDYPGYINKGVKLIEGESYMFLIHNHIQLTDDNYYFVLLDVNGLKHFIPSQPYTGYNFSVGDTIKCKIDRINCTGRIYLEPEHPYYKPEEKYSFKYKKIVNSAINHLLIVVDIFGNEVEIEVDDQYEPILDNENKVWCKLVQVKKGIPILEIFK